MAWPSLTFEHGRQTERAFVLLHGLTASPKQFEPFGRMLFERGHNVLIPRLPHHGHRDRMTKALAALTPVELKQCGQEALADARRLGKETTVIGFSTGGNVAAWLAQAEAIPHVVVIAPFLGSRWIPRRIAPAVARAILQLPNVFLWWDPVEREALMPEHGYPRYPTHGAAQAFMLAQEVLSAARARAPASERITLVANANENTVNNAAAGDLYRSWRLHARGKVEWTWLTGLPFSHDVIEPEKRRASPERLVYPRLLEIVEHGAPLAGGRDSEPFA